MAPSYKQNTAKIGEIHGTVNLSFKRPVHEGYMVLVRGSGGRVARAGRPACCVMLPPVLMSYREREEGGFLGVFPVGGCAGVAALFTSFS